MCTEQDTRGDQFLLDGIVQDTIFETYILASASPGNVINLEVPIAALHRALRTALNATSAHLRLTKKDGLPVLSLTITNSTFSSGNSIGVLDTTTAGDDDQFGAFPLDDDDADEVGFGGGASGIPRERETVITQDIPVKVLPLHAVEGLHEPKVKDHEVQICLPNLLQLKSISERFTRLAVASKAGSISGSAPGPRLELSANMHGALKLALRTDAISISSLWKDLDNPELDAGEVPGGSQGIRDHPTTRMKMVDGESEESWARVRIDGKDWGRVLSVGRVANRVIACKWYRALRLSSILTRMVGFIHDTALVLYVFLPNEEGNDVESCLTVSPPFPPKAIVLTNSQYYINSYSA